MVCGKMGLTFYRCGRGRGPGRGRTVHNTNFWKMASFNNYLSKNYPVDFYEIFRVCLSCRALLLCRY